MGEIIFDHAKLRGRIKEVLGTEKKFANKIHRSKPFVSAVFNNKAYFQIEDIYNSAKVLKIPQEEIGEFFLKEKFTDVNKQYKGE